MISEQVLFVSLVALESKSSEVGFSLESKKLNGITEVKQKKRSMLRHDSQELYRSRRTNQRTSIPPLPSGCWGIFAGCKILPVVKVVGLALLPRFPYLPSALGGLISTLVGMNRNYKK